MTYGMRYFHPSGTCYLLIQHGSTASRQYTGQYLRIVGDIHWV